MRLTFLVSLETRSVKTFTLYSQQHVSKVPSPSHMISRGQIYSFTITENLKLWNPVSQALYFFHHLSVLLSYVNFHWNIIYPFIVNLGSTSGINLCFLLKSLSFWKRSVGSWKS